MLMNMNTESEPQKNRWLRLAAIVSGGSLLLILVSALKDNKGSINGVNDLEGGIGLIQNLGKVLFTDYVIPFEISSVLFLSAMVGAVILGKKESANIKS
jgi:NADH-quinone oxidoreductase subunit J